MSNKDLYKKDWDNICPSQELKNKLMERIHSEMDGEMSNKDKKQGEEDTETLIILNKRKKPRVVYMSMAAAAVVAVAVIAGLAINSGLYRKGVNDAADKVKTTRQPKQTKNPETKSYTKYSYNKEYSLDLDGDKKEDVVTCKLKKRLVDVQYDSYEYNIEIDINGIKYSDVLTDLPQIEEYYFITDIDKNDKQKEVVIVDPGMSDDPNSMFFAYSNNKIKNVGSCPSYPDKFKYNDDGTFDAAMRLSIFQTWHAMQKYAYDDSGMIELVKQETYYPIETIDLKLLIELPVYENKDMSSEKTTIKPQKCRADELDDKKWVHLTFEDGSSGWIMMDSFSEINGIDEKDMLKVFDGLIWAD